MEMTAEKAVLLLSMGRPRMKARVTIKSTAFTGVFVQGLTLDQSLCAGSAPSRLKDQSMRELEVTEDPPQKNMAIMGMPMATVPPVPVPKRACGQHAYASVHCWHLVFRQSVGSVSWLIGEAGAFINELKSAIEYALGVGAARCF